MHAEEPRPQAEYLSTNHDQLVGLIELSHELLLRHEPILSVMVETNQLPSITVWGRELGSYDPSSLKGADAIMRAQEARQKLSDFSSQVTLRLIASDADRRGVDAEAPGAPRAMLSSDEARVIAAAVNNSGRTLASLGFVRSEAGQEIALDTITIHGEEAPLAHALTLTVDDGLLIRNMLLGYIERAPVAVDPPLWVVQSMGPSSDSDLRRITDFFLNERSDTVGYAAVMQVFQRVLRGQPADDLLLGLFGRYVGIEERQQLQEFVWIMQGRAESIREQRQFIMQNPELARPSPEELTEYTQLLRSLLGQA
jgi:hypothetical protein